MWWVWGFPFYCMFINICAAPWRHGPWHAVPPSRASRAQGGLNIDKVLPCAREDWLRLIDFASLLEFDRISLKILTFLLWIICMATGLLPCIVLILNTDRNQIRLDWNGLERISMKCKSAADYLFAVACIYALQLSLLSGMQWTKFNFAVGVSESHIYVRFMPLTQSWTACPHSFTHFLTWYQFTSCWSCCLRLVCLQGKRFWLPNTKGNQWVQRARSRSSRALAQTTSGSSAMWISCEIFTCCSKKSFLAGGSGHVKIKCNINHRMTHIWPLAFLTPNKNFFLPFKIHNQEVWHLVLLAVKHLSQANQGIKHTVVKPPCQDSIRIPESSYNSIQA